jgi:hypothetical protein
VVFRLATRPGRRLAARAASAISRSSKRRSGGISANPRRAPRTLIADKAASDQAKRRSGFVPPSWSCEFASRHQLHVELLIKRTLLSADKACRTAACAIHVGHSDLGSAP